MNSKFFLSIYLCFIDYFSLLLYVTHAMNITYLLNVTIFIVYKDKNPQCEAYIMLWLTAWKFPETQFMSFNQIIHQIAPSVFLSAASLHLSLRYISCESNTNTASAVGILRDQLDERSKVYVHPSRKKQACSSKFADLHNYTL